MGIAGLMLVTVVALLAGALAQEHTTQAYSVKRTSIVSKSHISIATERQLRSFQTSTLREDGEDRVNVPWLSKVDDLIQSMFKSSLSPDKVQIGTWVQSKVHPKDLFSTLRLGESAAKLDDNPNLLQWFRFVAPYQTKHGEKAILNLDVYYLLLETHSNQELMTLLKSLKKTPGLSKFASNIQESLSGAWVSKTLLKETSSKTAFEVLRLKEAGSKLDDTPVFHQWLKYVEAYRAKRGTVMFGDIDMFSLLQKTMPERELTTLFYSLRKVPNMKNNAETMQRFMFWKSKTSRKTMNDVWLKFREPPEEMFKVLRVAESRARDDSDMIQWLRYTQLFRNRIKKSAFSDEQTLQFLTKSDPLKSD